MLCSFRKYSSYLYLNDVYLGVGETLLLLDNENLYQ